MTTYILLVDMILNVSIGFSQLARSAEDSTIYALFVGDTVKVQMVSLTLRVFMIAMCIYFAYG